ncbi:MAG: DUF2341 domain-containing protein [Chloroflexota bacterium]|nr:DUF2341 domain-containing protein [Chloroflexota bacterium]
MFKTRKKQPGFTLLELVIVLSVISITMPVLGSAIYRTIVTPEDTSSSLGVSNNLSQAAAWITDDCGEFEVYLDVNDADYDDLIDTATDMDYGAFVELDDSGIAISHVRYFFEDGNLMRSTSEDDDAPLVVARGIVRYEDVTFEFLGDAVQITVVITDGDTSKSETFMAKLEVFGGHRCRTPITITYDGSGPTTLEDCQVMITLDSENFNYSHAGDTGNDLRFPSEYILYELCLDIPGDPSSSEPTSYDATIVISHAETLQHIATATGNDLRFYASQSSQPYGPDGFSEGDGHLSYWVQELGSSELEVIVRVPDVPGEGTSVYMYYGNPFAAPKSDGSIFCSHYWGFDDDSDLEDWEGAWGKWEVAEGCLQSHPGAGIIAYGDEDDVTYDICVTGQEYEALICGPSPATSDRQGIIFAYQDRDNYYEATVVDNDTLELSVYWFNKGKGGGGKHSLELAVQELDEGCVLEENEWYILRVQWIAVDQVIVDLVERESGDTIANITYVDEDEYMMGWESGQLGIKSNRAGKIDYISVRDIPDPGEFVPQVVLAGDADINETQVARGTETAMFSYWVESWNIGGESLVWIQLPYIAMGESVLYMYHCDPDAPNQSAEMSVSLAEGLTASVGLEQWM